jgi:hypothetical protein
LILGAQIAIGLKQKTTNGRRNQTGLIARGINELTADAHWEQNVQLCT